MGGRGSSGSENPSTPIGPCQDLAGLQWVSSKSSLFQLQAYNNSVFVASLSLIKTQQEWGKFASPLGCAKAKKITASGPD